MGAAIRVIDDLGFPVELNRPPERIVSLVPSWTETLFALGLKDRIVGVTKFCVEPAPSVALLPKIGGTKKPDIAAIMKLEPDFVVANAEENRREDVERIRDRGVAVFTTYPRTVAAAAESILKLGKAVGAENRADALVRDIVRAVSEVETIVGPWSKLRLRVFCPIWKKPWMTFNGDTYAHDVLRMMGFNNVFASAGERYPRVTLDDALKRRPQVVLLPDEPYRFGRSDVDEIKAMVPPELSRRVLLVNGRDLHWYGAHMVRGLKALASRLSRVRAALI